ncbi:MAG: hypothetical protein AB1486_32710 [Planctomycetota bacterium]
MPEHIEDPTNRRIRQLSLFLPNRTGELLRITKTLEAEGIHICGISILDSADHCVVRLVADDPAKAVQALDRAGHRVFETEILGVMLPPGKGVGIRKILAALLMAEVNVHFAYPVIVYGSSRLGLALYGDDMPEATRILAEQGLDLIGQDDLAE